MLCGCRRPPRRFRSLNICTVAMWNWIASAVSSKFLTYCDFVFGSRKQSAINVKKLLHFSIFQEMCNPNIFFTTLVSNLGRYSYSSCWSWFPRIWRLLDSFLLTNKFILCYSDALPSLSWLGWKLFQNRMQRGLESLTFFSLLPSHCLGVMSE